LGLWLVRLNEGGKFDSEEFEEACRNAPQKVAARAYLLIGQRLAGIKYREEAISWYRKAAKWKPGRADAYAHWGMALLDLGKAQERLKSANKR
jgi:tetratricopeptide (TPR) repeat protein